MTYEEKDKVIQDYCDTIEDCRNCKVEHICSTVLGDFESHEEECDEAFNIVYTLNNQNDIVNHPPHYCREGSMECIEEMELIFGKEAVKHFCLCNAWKYRYRSSAKNGEEDIKKSDWYIQKYKELTSNE